MTAPSRWVVLLRDMLAAVERSLADLERRILAAVPAGLRVVVHVRFLAVFTLAAGLCAWTGDARAHGSAETDRAALVAVYRATGGDDWTENAKWLTDAPIGGWYGVETNEQGRVTGLRLGGWDETAREFVGNGLTGMLSPELGTLSHLRRLEIGGNSGLSGPIPAALGNLANLESLFLQANWLTGPIPATLGRLGNLDWLGFDGNALTGSIPADLGNLTNLHGLTLSGNALSGSLPESLSKLSALGFLNLDTTGLCVPDRPAMRAWVAGLSDFSGVFCVGSVTFSRVVTQPGLGRLEHVLAVADLDGDGRDDILAGGEYDAYATRTLRPEQRFTKTTLHLFVGVEDGSFEHAPELIEGTIAVRSPIVVANDFNSDGRADLAVFDEGVYVFAERLGYGNPPQLFLSSPDGRLRPSDALADAVRREHELRLPPIGFVSGPADLHLKSATSGDIDGDGNMDLWVESTGGVNVYSHFMVNNGDGTFTIEPARASDKVLRNNPPDYWRHTGNHLVDLDNDGDFELALGQSRTGSVSIVLVNDGTGHYPTRTELPQAPLNDGYTRVSWLTHFDVNKDGFQDLLLAHRRLYEGPTTEIPDTGRYIQVLINRDGTSFSDETPTWMGDQSATTPERDAEGDELFNDGAPRMHDVDRDGCADIVMSRSIAVRTEAPLVYRNDGTGQFRAMSPVPFAGSDRNFGHGAVPADVNGDAAIDFVIPQHHDGPDRRYGTADDFTTLVTLLNTTPAGPVRCRPRVTTVGTLPARTLHVGAGAIAVVVPAAGAFRHASAYRASSSAPGVATVSVSGSQVTVTPAADGVVTITVTATGADDSVATQRFSVTVLATTAFTDDLSAGVTRVKAVHFLELRTRVAALRARAGLPPVRWTDPVLTVGVTPVKRVHLTELRTALDAAYDAAGRQPPPYTDDAVIARVTAIRAVHVAELRDAILALE